MKTLLILGSDRISASALSRIDENSPALHIIIDESSSPRRLLRLMGQGRLGVVLVLKMAFCEFTRNAKLPQNKYDTIRSNAELIDVVSRIKFDRVVLFRAGLIINQAIIESGLPIFNIHCALVPEYGGLGSIARALRAGEIRQAACLHSVTATIDNGEVLDREPYLLNLRESYCYNENIAYEAGIHLLQRTVTVR